MTMKPNESIESLQRLLQPRSPKPKRKKFPWTLSEREVGFVRGNFDPWHVRQTSGKRASVCRACGEKIPKGERLSFYRFTETGLIYRQGHIHINPCVKSSELVEHEREEKMLKEYYQHQQAEADELLGPDTPTVLTEATIAKGASFFIYPGE